MSTRFRRLLPVLLAAALGGCSSYLPAPLAQARTLTWSGSGAAPAMPAAQPDQNRFDSTRPLTDALLLQRVLQSNPDLIATRAQLRVAQAQLAAAGIVSDLGLTASYERPSGSGVVDALGAALSLDLATLAARPARLDGARASAQKVRHDVAWSEWLTVNQARAQARRVYYLDRQHTLARAAGALATDQLVRQRQNLRLGDARLDDVSLARTALLDTADRELGLARSLAAARQQLNALLGLPPDTEVLIEPPALHARPTAEGPELLQQAIMDRQDLQALRAGYAAQEAELKAAHRLGLPLPQLSLSRARDTSAVSTVGVAASLTTALLTGNRAGIAVAQASREQLAAEYSARLQQLRADIAATWADLAALQAQRQALQDELPALRSEAAELAAASVDHSISALTYETVRAALLDKELGALALDQAQAEGEVALETAVGGVLWGPP